MHESDEEETLSLCDLPLYSNSSTDQSSEWEQFSASTSISSSSQDDDYFEFSSQEFTPSAAADFPPENIIFCGKLIPYKQPHHNNNNSNQPMIQKANNSSNSPDLLIIESKKNRIEMWKNSSSSNGARGTTLMQSSPPKKTYNTNKQLNLSLFTSSSSSGKTKWYFLFFGSPRFSTEVDLRDFKSRRRSLRRQFSSPPPMFRFEDDEDDDDDGDGDFVSGGRNRRWGLWGMLIKVLSCGGGNHQSAAASIGCSTPRATET